MRRGKPQCESCNEWCSKWRGSHGKLSDGLRDGACKKCSCRAFRHRDQSSRVVKHEPFKGGGNRHEPTKGTLSYLRKQGKYNRVQRAYPYPDRGEIGCAWTRTYTPDGRRILVPRAVKVSA